jgi:uncharacterized protein (DUF2235 family)
MPREPRNIVLLSDGTGNSSAKLRRTNVWRLYEALDLSTGAQVALYDDGVGTSSFKPFAILGGALGWGLKRNVRDLYSFACRNFRPAQDDKPDDRLYVFGFSRGAFTARVVVALIEDQGLIAGARGAELERLAKWAYRGYRRKFDATGGLVTPLRNLRDVILRAWEGLLGLPSYEEVKRRNVHPRVSFLGLFDTVDAYGLPVAEMKWGWDDWVWPLSMCTPEAPAIANKICHALALDDERQTFHPLLMTEAGRKPTSHTSEETLSQVWFAGAHSNIGGGYPNDSLSYVPLLWMAEEAAKTDLKLHKVVLDGWRACADPNGPAHDSRRGLGSYYRYMPRSVADLSADHLAGVEIRRPKIHESVFQRIAIGPQEYAPVVLPENYAVVRTSGEIVDGDGNPFEHPTQSRLRTATQEQIWNLVWLRRLAYFATLILTLFIAVPSLIGDRTLDQRSLALSGVIESVSKVLPDTVQPWMTYHQENPVRLSVLVVLLGFLWAISAGLQARIQDRMRGIWNTTADTGPQVVTTEPKPPGFAGRVVYGYRTHRMYLAVRDALTERVFPFVFGLGALLSLAVIGVGTVNRAVFAVATATGQICREIPEPVATASATWTSRFNSRELCHSTGIRIETGVRYTIRVELPEGWSDGDLRVATPAGFGSARRPAVLIPALPFRRMLTQPWFRVIARVGAKGAEYHPITQADSELVSRKAGQLFLFVNDAVAPGAWDYFYDNNSDVTATVTVKRLGGRP